MNDIVIFVEKNASFYCDRFHSLNEKDPFIGFGSEVQNVIMIILSFFGIFINLYFALTSIKRIINKDKSKNVNISSIEKILSIISVTETFISICWLINSFKMNTQSEQLENCEVCCILGIIELFLYIFDWMILISTLIQIKQILTNPLETLKTEKNIFRYIIFCVIFGLATGICGFYADVEGVSPMLTCFIDVSGWNYEDNEKIYRTIFFFMFFFIPICILLYGIYQGYSIIQLPQYKSNKKNRKFFKSYLQYIFTYIILALLLISVYVCDAIIDQNEPNKVMKIYINIVTILSCSTPLIVGIIRLVKTKLIKKLLFCSCIKNINNDNIDYKKSEYLNGKEKDDFHFIDFEEELICKEFKKIFIGISYILDKSKQLDNEETDQDKKEKMQSNEKEETNLINTNNINNNEIDINDENEFEFDNYYKINKQEILKDFDLGINEDIFVLVQDEIDIVAIEYCPKFFKQIRNADKIKEDYLVEVFQPKNVIPELFKKTNDSNYYINSTNKQFILKSMSLEQIEFYKNYLKRKKINEYLEKNKDSIINRVYGLYYLKIDNNKNYYIALMDNIYESIDKDLFINNKDEGPNINNSKEDDEPLEIKNNLEEKKMYFNENEINDKIVTNNVDEVNSDNRKNSNKNLIRKESLFSIDKKYKIYLDESEGIRLKEIIKKDIGFLHKVGTGRVQFFVVKKTLSEYIFNNLFNNDIKEKNIKDNDNTGIKKYIFKSNIENVIYCITISGYFNNYNE